MLSFQYIQLNISWRLWTVHVYSIMPALDLLMDIDLDWVSHFMFQSLNKKKKKFVQSETIIDV